MYLKPGTFSWKLRPMLLYIIRKLFLSGFCRKFLLKAVMWIRMSFNADPDPAFFLNADPDPGLDPDPAIFDTLDWEKFVFLNLFKNIFQFFRFF